ncbi:MAG TPA: DUF3761 domain-containing protein [Steroidobacteraceae bacterium]|nr:DUF3761 domain-containing protein [Steroidobacteraceae bacterium]
MRSSSIHRSLSIVAALAVFAFAMPAQADSSKKSEVMVQCKDGSSSKAGHGACSHHGGVQPATAKCKDGSMYYGESHSGACSSHGGVDKWLDKEKSDKK